MYLFEKCDTCARVRLMDVRPNRPRICTQCKAEMPQENCDTGRRIHPTKQLAEADDAIRTNADRGRAERCDRCKGWHAKNDRPRSRRNRNSARR